MNAYISFGENCTWVQYIFSRVITFFRKSWVIQCGLREVSTVHKKFEPLLYLKFFLETMSNFLPIGADSLKWGRLAGFLQYPRTFLKYSSNFLWAPEIYPSHHWITLHFRKKGYHSNILLSLSLGMNQSLGSGSKFFKFRFYDFLAFQG